MADYKGTVRSVLIPISSGKVLLPNATVSEVITFTAPEPIDDAPEWIMGQLRWRGRRIPLFSFSKLTGELSSENTNNAKIAVLKGIGTNSRLPFLAMLAQGFPRLTLVNDESMQVNETDQVPTGVHSIVSVKEEVAMIPDLNAIEQMFADHKVG